MDKFVSLKEIENAALEILPKASRDYYASGATDELTLAENKKAFDRIRIRPKCMMGINQCSMKTTVLGQEISMPIGISPTAMQRMAHHDGELASARAAEADGVIFTLSTIATSSIEEVADAAPKALKWFQLYIYNDRELTKTLVRRAEKAGFKAIALTVDAPLFGIRRADVTNKFTLPQHLRLANFDGQNSNKIHKSNNGSGLNEYVNSLFDKTLSWEDVEWLKSITKLPIIAKGILRGDDAVKAAKAGCAGILVSNHGARQLDGVPATVRHYPLAPTKLPIIAKGILRGDDAVKAAKAGCAGILVSNHGARQLDGVPATIEALPEIIEAIKAYNVEVYLDGGVSSGTDVYKALALGARMVFVGRPVLWGLAVGGKCGVRRMLSILRSELESSLLIAGTPTIADITRDMVRHRVSYSKL